ncbi:MAG: hypothetical protein WCR60_00635 [Patescibacteria group bacterium]
MLFLIFKIFCWQQGCRPSLALLFIEFSLILISLLIIILIFYIIDYLFWTNKLKALIKFQENYCQKTAVLLDTAKIALFSINSQKNLLTSLRLILDSFKDPVFLKDKQLFKQYLSKADRLLLTIKKREDLLNKQLVQKNDKRLFALTEEICSLLSFYQDTLKLNNIKLEFTSSREYRIFAYQDQLLRIINTILLSSIESLISINKKAKYLKIYFTRTPYLLKIFIEDNVGLTNAKSIKGLIEINSFNNEEMKQFKLKFYLANQMMKEYFHKKIEITNKTNKQTIVCLKIKNSFILAEPKLDKKIVFKI